MTSVFANAITYEVNKEIRKMFTSIDFIIMDRVSHNDIDLVWQVTNVDDFILNITIIITTLVMEDL